MAWGVPFGPSMEEPRVVLRIACQSYLRVPCRLCHQNWGGQRPHCGSAQTFWSKAPSTWPWVRTSHSALLGQLSLEQGRRLACIRTAEHVVPDCMSAEPTSPLDCQIRK